LEEKQSKKSKSTAKHSGEKLMNFLKKKESSNKSKRVKKKFKTEKPITNCLSGRQQGVMKSISTQAFIQSSSPNSIQSKRTDTLLKTFTKWD
jgi:hypothetical protein